MPGYKIFTDSCCDLSAELLAGWGVVSTSLIFSDGEHEHTNAEMTADAFYKKMREGARFFTSAPAPALFEHVFRQAADEGCDVLYLGFSSGLSSTCASAEIAAGTLQPEYRDRTFICIDTLCASAGQGLILHCAVENQKAGMTIEENAQAINDLLPKLSHWFTVDDLNYLYRGGRLSAVSAIAGTMLGIKPVLHVDDEGHLINMKKVRGRRSAIKALADKYAELAEDPENGVYYISHGACLEDAKALEQLISGKYGHGAAVITDVGPVIGSHTGPGVLALFFIGKNR